MDYLATLLHKDHRRIYYPRSLGVPEHTKEEWLKFAADFVGKFWTDCEVSYLVLVPSSHRTPFSPSVGLLPQPEVHSIIEAPGKVVVHVCVPIIRIATAVC